MKRSFMRQTNDRNLRLRAGPRRGAGRSVSRKGLPGRFLQHKHKVSSRSRGLKQTDEENREAYPQ